MIKCDKCNNNISDVIQRGDGLPNAIGFELEDGRVITLCADCISKLGELKERNDEAGLKAFFKAIGVEV